MFRQSIKCRRAISYAPREITGTEKRVETLFYTKQSFQRCLGSDNETNDNSALCLPTTTVSVNIIIIIMT
jgi:hypothetical protein